MQNTLHTWMIFFIKNIYQLELADCIRRCSGLQTLNQIIF